MLNLIRKTLGLDAAAAAPPTAHGIELMAAVLLLEAAHADYECTQVELQQVVGTMQRMFNLSTQEAQELMELAQQERGGAVDLHDFTRRVNEGHTRQQKLQVLEAVWRVIYADGVMDKYEEHFARKLADLLWLEHRDFIDTKLRVRDEMTRG